MAMNYGPTPEEAACWEAWDKDQMGDGIDFEANGLIRNILEAYREKQIQRINLTSGSLRAFFEHHKIRWKENETQLRPVDGE